MKPKLIWPSISEELIESAERRRMQRDRENRSSTNTPSSNDSGKPNKSSARVSANAIIKPKSSKQLLNRSNSQQTAKGKGSSTEKTNYDENQPPEQRLKQKHLTDFFTPKNEVKNKVSKSSEKIAASSLQLLSPTPIKRAKSNKQLVCYKRIESPAIDGHNSKSTSSNSKERVMASKEHISTPNCIVRIEKSNHRINGEKQHQKGEEEKMLVEPQKPAVDQAELDRKRVEGLVRRLKLALTNRDREKFLEQLKKCISLPEHLISSIASPFLRYLVIKEIDKRVTQAKIRMASMEERKNCRKERQKLCAEKVDTHFDHLIIRFLSGKYEDTIVMGPKECNHFCELDPVLPDLARHFGRALSILHFTHTHQRFLGKFTSVRYKRRTSTENIILSMAGGSSNAYILEELLNFLTGFFAKDVQIKPKIISTQRSLRSRNLKMTIREEKPTLVDTLKLYLKKAYSEIGDGEVKSIASETDKENDSDDRLREALSELGQATYFHELSVGSQLSILEYFICRIVESAEFHEYMEKEGTSELGDKMQLISELRKTETALQDELAVLERQLQQFQSDDLVTRNQTSEFNKIMRELKTKYRQLEDVNEQLTEVTVKNRLLKLSAKMRASSMGQDRFYRDYWYFAGTPDEKAVFVQQHSHLETCPFGKSATHDEEMQVQSVTANAEAKNDVETDEEEFFQKFQEIVDGRPCICHDNARDEHWFAVRTVTSFNSLLDSLHGNSIREGALKATLLQYKDLIMPKLTQRNKEEDVNGKEENEEEDVDGKEENEEEDVDGKEENEEEDVAGKEENEEEDVGGKEVGEKYEKTRDVEQQAEADEMEVEVVEEVENGNGA